MGDFGIKTSRFDRFVTVYSATTVHAVRGYAGGSYRDFPYIGNGDYDAPSGYGNYVTVEIQVDPGGNWKPFPAGGSHHFIRVWARVDDPMNVEFRGFLDDGSFKHQP